MSCFLFSACNWATHYLSCREGPQTENNIERAFPLLKPLSVTEELWWVTKKKLSKQAISPLAHAPVGSWLNTGFSICVSCSYATEKLHALCWSIADVSFTANTETVHSLVCVIRWWHTQQINKKHSTLFWLRRDWGLCFRTDSYPVEQWIKWRNTERAWWSMQNMSVGFGRKICNHKFRCHKTNTPTHDKIRESRTV